MREFQAWLGLVPQFNAVMYLFEMLDVPFFYELKLKSMSVLQIFVHFLTPFFLKFIDRKSKRMYQNSISKDRKLICRCA